MSEPLPGKTHDANAVDELDLTDLLRADNSIGDKGFIGTGPTTPFRKPPAVNYWTGKKNSTQQSTKSATSSNRSSRTTRPGGACSPTTADHYAPTQPPSTRSGHSTSSNFVLHKPHCAGGASSLIRTW